MKIICTALQQNILTELVQNGAYCLFAEEGNLHYGPKCDDRYCGKCFKDNVTWQIASPDDDEAETPSDNSTTSYQLRRAKDYLENEKPKDGSEPTEEWCIISDLMRSIQENEEEKGA